MRFLLLFALLYSAVTGSAQADLWSHVDLKLGRQQLQPAFLSGAQVNAFAKLLRKQKPEDIWDCQSADLDHLIEGLQFESIPAATPQKLVLAEAPAGCARGGQGANGAMWVVRFDGDIPFLLASPKEFSGWLFSVQPTSSSGYPDIILGWHMSAREADLSYFRFEGKSYRQIGKAKLQTDDAGNQKIVPEPISLHTPCHPAEKVSSDQG
jgi:hypothetical protein